MALSNASGGTSARLACWVGDADRGRGRRARQVPLAARHPRRFPPARGARPRGPHPPRYRAALRRLEGPRGRPHVDVRHRPDRVPADPAARRAPPPAPPAAPAGRLPRRGGAPRTGCVSEIRKAKLTGIRVAVAVESGWSCRGRPRRRSGASAASACRVARRRGTGAATG